MSAPFETSEPTAVPVTEDGAAQGAITRPLVILFATSVGVIVTNLFAPQTLVGPITTDLGLASGMGGLVAMASLLGYACGLFLLVPLAGLTENRALIVRMLACASAAALIAAVAPNALCLLSAFFVLGAACSAIQVLVPIAAAMAPAGEAGRVIGDVMGGLMIGILLARPSASAIAGSFGSRGFYEASAGAMVVLVLVLALRLPVRRPLGHGTYAALIASLWHLLCEEPILRRRSLTASLAMAAFSLFWTSIALRLAQAPFELDQRGIALFALVGAGGAIVTPLAGRAGDRGWTRWATIASHLVIILGFALAAWAGTASGLSSWTSIGLLGASAVLLDIGVTGDQTLGRRAVNLLRPQARGRLNGLFVGLFFLGGAGGSAIAGLAWTTGGWLLICAIGALFGLIALSVACCGRRT